MGYSSEYHSGRSTIQRWETAPNPRDRRMLIKTTCPRCESTYQVDPALRGKRMRCPNASCRWIFEVHEVGTPPPPPTPPAAPASTTPPSSQRTGAVEIGR